MFQGVVHDNSIEILILEPWNWGLAQIMDNIYTRPGTYIDIDVRGCITILAAAQFQNALSGGFVQSNHQLKDLVLVAFVELHGLDGVVVGQFKMHQSLILFLAGRGVLY
jgi:hypothetical protein